MLVEWKELRERLLNSQLSEGQGCKNRRRIIILTRKFVIRVLPQKDSQDDFQAPMPTSTSSCLQSISCWDQSTLTQESLNFDTAASGSGQRTLRFTFQSRKAKPTIVGIAHCVYAGSSVLGTFHDPDGPSVKLGLEDQLRGFIVGIAAKGLVGIKAIIGLTDSRDVSREESFDSFKGNVALGRLLSTTGVTVVGLRCGRSKVSTDTLHLSL